MIGNLESPVRIREMRSIPFELHPPTTETILSAIRFAVPYVAAVLILLLPFAVGDRSLPTPVGIVSVQLSEDPPAGTDRKWLDVDLESLTLPAGGGLLRAVFDIDRLAAQSGKPLGLYLSGTFSASAIWNGVSVGSKGSPGTSPASERAGPIDAVLYLPGNIVLPGQNILELRMSSHHLTHRVESIVHGTRGIPGLRVAPYSANERRSIGYYAAPFIVSGIMLIALLILGMHGVPKEDACRRVTLLLLSSLTLTAIAEVSRSMINYPYPFHDLRMLVILLSAVTAGIALILYASKAAGLSAQWMARFAVVTSAVIAAALVTGSIGTLPVRVLTLAAGIGSILAARGVLRRQPGAAVQLAAMAMLFAFALFDRDLFMDRSLYAASVPLIAHLVLRDRGIQNPPQLPAGDEKSAGERNRIVITSGGTDWIIPLEEIRVIHGAGNYSEVELSSGKRILDDRSLALLSAELPLPFFRIHRSHIVNLRHTTKLESLGSGKYVVELVDGSCVPVSRARVSDLRHVLGTKFSALS
jgi:DNA-binding LytR/AlgR family response regulator